VSAAPHPLQQALSDAGNALRKGNAQHALAILQKARTQAPRDLHVLNLLGTALAILGRHGEALAVFDAALALAPDKAALHLNRGHMLEEVGRLADADAALAEAIRLEPRNADALARLAGLSVRRGDYAAARDSAARALAVAPVPAASLALARADIEAGAFEAALAGVEPLLKNSHNTPVNRSIAWGLKGDALDALERPVEAFAAYAAAREILRVHFTPMFEAAGAETAAARARRLIAYFEGAAPQAWRAAAPAPVPATPLHVFLVGFPRSGTTLLEQILASHPDVETLEETDCLPSVAEDFVGRPGGLDRLAALPPAALDEARAAYWKRAAELGATRRRRVFIDKLPLNTLHLCVVAKLFPQAKVLFALRDPRDVVLSCFRRRLAMTPHMFEFSTLERAASYYDLVMRLAAAYRAKLALPILESRHEALIGDFEGETRRLCEFLGLEWNADLRGFAGLARTRDIKTPSGPQILRGLSQGGAGQWRRYAAQLAPVLPKLSPWVRRFGYTDA
jgi:tetratricopeptide (TPR) repeat protein